MIDLKSLLQARIDLLSAQASLALVRKFRYPEAAQRAAEAVVCRAIDRLWDVQSMTVATF
jgi:hypothetical protein